MEEEREDISYDRTYRIGGTTIHIVAPKITEEERERRLKEIARVIMILLELSKCLHLEIRENTENDN